MSNEMYESPKSDLQQPIDEQPSTIKAILYSAIIDIGGTLIFGVIFGIVYGAYLAAQGFSELELVAKFQNIELLSGVGVFTILVGCSISFYAGKYCAKKSVKNIHRNVAVLCVFSCSFVLLTGLGQYSFMENTALLLLTVLALFGGAFYHIKKHT